jgi:hypothetical protein
MTPRRHMSFKRTALAVVALCKHCQTECDRLSWAPCFGLEISSWWPHVDRRLLLSGRTTNNSGMMRAVLRNTADPLRQQMFQIEYAQAPQLWVTQYLQPNLHLCLAHNSGLASFANNTFF